MSRFSPNTQERHIQAIADEFLRRSLSYVDGNIAKLVYLSSCRDYNSGKYRHDGLADQFAETSVHEALAHCHRELFDEMIQSPLSRWVDELRRYFNSTAPESLTIWKELRPYLITIPLDTPPLAAELFASNLRIALEILDLERRN